MFDLRLGSQMASDKLGELPAKSTNVFVILIAALLTLPWLNPFAPGPSPAVGPWLWSALCAASALLVYAVRCSGLGASVFRPPPDVARAAAWSLLAAGLVSSVLALLQYADLEAFFAPWVNPTQPGVAFANLRQRNHFATLTNMALVALLYLGTHVPQEVSAKRAWPMAWALSWVMGWVMGRVMGWMMGFMLAAASLLAAGNAVSSSRTGLLQLALVCGLSAVWGGWQRATIRRPLVCAVSALLVYAVRCSGLGASVFRPPPDVARVAAWSLLAAGLVSSVLALLQYADLEAFFAPWVNPTQPGVAFANLRQRNHFATLTNMALVALLYMGIHGQPAASAERFWPMAWGWGFVLAGASLLAAGNAVSSSRTGLLQLALVCGLSAVWGGWQRATIRRPLVCAVAVYAAVTFAAPWLAGFDLATHGAFARLGSDAACSSRVTLWSNVLHLIAQKPWLGWGWGELDYAHFITLYDEPRFCDILDNAHNLPLHLAVELGLPLAVLLCGGLAWWVLRQKPWTEQDTARQMAWAVLAVMLLHSMLEYPLWYGPFQIAFGLCVWVLWQKPKATCYQKSTEKNKSNTPLPHVNIGFSAIILGVLGLISLSFSAIAYAAWDYRRVSQIYLQPEARALDYQNDTLAQASKSWLFRDQALFAELILTPLTRATAERVSALAGYLLHYSPEPRVVVKLIESAVMLGNDAEALAYLARFKAAFPREHADWSKANLTVLKD